MECSKKFVIDGREYSAYSLSNSQIVKLMENSEDKEELLKEVYARFKYDLCPRCGETEDNLFAHTFSRFVNGKMISKSEVANTMCNEHRYLQNEMFKVCLEYIKRLADNCEKGRYDPRNEYAAETSKKIIDFLKEADYPY